MQRGRRTYADWVNEKPWRDDTKRAVINLQIDKVRHATRNYNMFTHGRQYVFWDQWMTASGRKVARAIQLGMLPDLKAVRILCGDCQQRPATEYDHRDYERPLEVQPVCHACNGRRGRASIPHFPADPAQRPTWAAYPIAAPVRGARAAKKPLHIRKKRCNMAAKLAAFRAASRQRRDAARAILAARRATALESNHLSVTSNN